MGDLPHVHNSAISQWVGLCGDLITQLTRVVAVFVKNCGPFITYQQPHHHLYDMMRTLTAKNPLVPENPSLGIAHKRALICIYIYMYIIIV